MCFLADDRTLALGHSFSRTVTFWDVDTGELQQRLGEGSTRAVWAPTALAVSPDGSSIVYGDADVRQLVVRNLASHTEFRIRGEDAFRGAAFSPDAVSLATSEGTGIVRLWNLRSRQSQIVMRDGECVAFSPDGRLLAAGSNDGVQIWDTAAQDKQPPWECDSRVGILRFSPDGRMLAAICSDKTVRVYEVATGRQLALIDLAGANAIYCLCFSRTAACWRPAAQHESWNFGGLAISR